MVYSNPLLTRRIFLSWGILLLFNNHHGHGPNPAVLTLDLYWNKNFSIWPVKGLESGKAKHYKDFHKENGSKRLQVALEALLTSTLNGFQFDFTPVKLILYLGQAHPTMYRT